MTVVAALEEGRTVHLAGDSFAGSDVERDVVDRPKWFFTHGMTVAYAGSYAVAQMVEHSVAWRALRRGEKELSYLVEMAGLCRRACEKVGLKEGPSLLVALRGRVYVVQEDWSVIRSAHGYAAIGSGAPYALGSLASTEGDPSNRLTSALEAAERHCTLVGRPFVRATCR
jgi:ATP-dependent protease HslVU (ClpYQ) peptidase subunit